MSTHHRCVLRITMVVPDGREWVVSPVTVMGVTDSLEIEIDRAQLQAMLVCTPEGMKLRLSAESLSHEMTEAELLRSARAHYDAAASLLASATCRTDFASEQLVYPLLLSLCSDVSAALGRLISARGGR